MYIRIQEQTIRFRVSRDEAEALIDGKWFIDSLSLSPTFSLSYSVESCDQTSHFEYSAEKQAMILKVNRQQLSQEIANRPSKKGLTILHQIDEANTIQVSLEVNLKKSKP